MAKQLRRFVITFDPHFPMERVQGMLESNFMGWGKVHAGKDIRTQFLYPDPGRSLEGLRRDLDELAKGRVLTYFEDTK